MDEERLLLRLLDRPDCPECWQSDRRLLHELYAVPAVRMPRSLPDRIAHALDQVVDGVEKRRIHRKNQWQRWIPYTVAAAFCGALFGLHLTDGRPCSIYVDTCLNTAEAACMSEDVLAYVADEINNAMDETVLGGPCE